MAERGQFGSDAAAVATHCKPHLLTSGRTARTIRRSRSGNRQSAAFTRFGFQCETWHLKLAKIGELDIRWTRQLPGEPSIVHVSRTPTGRYFVSPGQTAASPAGRYGQIGIDLGLTCFALPRSQMAASTVRRDRCAASWRN